MKRVNWLIQHQKWVGTPGTASFKVFKNIQACSHRPGDIVVDSLGNKYQVQKDYSIKRV